MIKNYIQSPLPFQGQKRTFLKLFREGLKQFDQSTTFVDLFGGSGLLSHSIKQTRPDARVIYNDYDNFSERLRNVDKTNALIADIRAILGDNERKALIKEPVRGKISKGLSRLMMRVSLIILLFLLRYYLVVNMLPISRK